VLAPSPKTTDPIPMLDRDTAHAVADLLSQTGFFQFLFPLLTLLGPSLFFYWGVRGLRNRRTVLMTRVQGSFVATRLSGWPAVALSVVHVALAAVLLLAMAPITLAIIGLW
jgi:hypothetical protein